MEHGDPGGALYMSVGKRSCKSRHDWVSGRVSVCAFGALCQEHLQRHRL